MRLAERIAARARSRWKPSAFKIGAVLERLVNSASGVALVSGCGTKNFGRS